MMKAKINNIVVNVGAFFGVASLGIIGVAVIFAIAIGLSLLINFIPSAIIYFILNIALGYSFTFTKVYWWTFIVALILNKLTPRVKVNN